MGIDHSASIAALGDLFGELNPALRGLLHFVGVDGDAVTPTIVAERPTLIRFFENGKKARQVGPLFPVHPLDDAQLRILENVSVRPDHDIDGGAFTGGEDLLCEIVGGSKNKRAASA